MIPETSQPELKERAMKDIYEVIRQKEADLERIQREVEALKLSAKLLEENARPAVAAASISTPAATPAYSPTPARQSTGQPVAAPSAWASAKQFP